MDAIPRPLLLFDGSCALCDGTVRWLIRHDRGRLHYAPLESEIADRALAGTKLEGDASSVVLIDDEGIHQRSTAVWRVLQLLPWPWRAGAASRFVPPPLREAGYKLISRTRYRIFGRADFCELVSSLPPEAQGRILTRPIAPQS